MALGGKVRTYVRGRRIKHRKRVFIRHRAAILLSLLLVAGVFAAVKPAAAFFQVCNNTDSGMDVAMAYQSGASEGWWSIASGECVRTVEGDLQDQIYYVYAESYIVGLIWEGEESFCIDQDAPFRLNRSNCPTKDLRGFEQVNIAGRPNWTHTIEEESGTMGSDESQAASCIVELVSPGANAVQPQRRVGEKVESIWPFSWSECPGATRYHLYVIGPNALNPVVNDDNVTGTSFVERSSHYGVTSLRGWTWKVRAFVGGSWGEWSETRTFDVSRANP